MGWGTSAVLYLNGGDLLEPEMAPPSFIQYCTSISSGIYSFKRYSLADGESTQEEG
jgi:hypothetical protein